MPPMDKAPVLQGERGCVGVICLQSICGVKPILLHQGHCYLPPAWSKMWICGRELVLKWVKPGMGVCGSLSLLGSLVGFWVCWKFEVTPEGTDQASSLFNYNLPRLGKWEGCVSGSLRTGAKSHKNDGNEDVTHTGKVEKCTCKDKHALPFLRGKKKESGETFRSVLDGIRFQ